MSSNSPQTGGRSGASHGTWISLIAAIAFGLIIGACAQNQQGSVSSGATPIRPSTPAAQATKPAQPTQPAQPTPPGQPGAGAPPAQPGPGDPAKGKQLFQTLACNTCHTAPGMGSAVIGPPLTDIGTIAATRRPGYSAGQYLVESITHPNDFIVTGYQPNLMPATFATLPPDQLNDLVAYLASLK